MTDGDGYLYVNKDGNVGFELTLPVEDEKVLRIIQNKFGGNIKARGGVKAVRYRTQRREVMYKIVNCLNGFVINNVRLAQLHKVCLFLNIPIKEPIIPTIDSAYMSGLLDSDGTINIYKHKYNDTFRYQLTISISNKYRCNLQFLLDMFSVKQEPICAALPFPLISAANTPSLDPDSALATPPFPLRMELMQKPTHPMGRGEADTGGEQSLSLAAGTRASGAIHYDKAKNGSYK